MSALPELPRPTVAEPAFAATMEKGMNVSYWAQRLPQAPAVEAPSEMTIVLGWRALLR